MGFRRLLHITADGIRYRLFRAAVTVAVIVVAVAFLLNILSESLIKRSVAQDTQDQIERARLVHTWTSRLSAPGTVASVMGDLARTDPRDHRRAELMRMASLDDDAASQLSDRAEQAVVYLAFFSDLDYARRRRLVHQAEGVAIFDRLADPARFEQFREILKATPSVRLTGSVEDLAAFLTDWPRFRAAVERIREGQAAAIARVTGTLEGREVTRALVDAEGRFGDTIREAGFSLDEETAHLLASQARRVIDTQVVEKSLEHRSTRQVIARQHDILPGDVTMPLLWRFVANRDNAARFLAAMQEAGSAAEGMQPDRLAALSHEWVRMNRLQRAERLTAGIGGGWLGLGQRMGWLLLVSMLVCAIGISNAMLMTVTERFREIATLKCLGALDGSIMVMFVLESCIMGVVGGIAGGILGAILGSARMLIAFGPSFAGSIPLTDLAASMGVAILIGVVLAAAAAVYPSFRAARLAPMEAMRVE